MDKIRVSDDSSDRKYFTIIPNYIANHSTANDQALYFQLKKHFSELGKKSWEKRKAKLLEETKTKNR